MLDGNIDPDLIVGNFDRKDTHIVSEEIECTAAGEIEAGVVPVAGQDAVTHRAAIQRKAHVRTAIIDRIDLIAVEEEYDGMPIDPHRKRSLAAQIGELRRLNKSCFG